MAEQQKTRTLTVDLSFEIEVPISELGFYLAEDDVTDRDLNIWEKYLTPWVNGEPRKGEVSYIRMDVSDGHD